MPKTIPCPTFTDDQTNSRIPKDWDGECCHFCGRPLSLKNRQGWFAVGPVCKKKVPRGFSTKNLPNQ